MAVPAPPKRPARAIVPKKEEAKKTLVEIIEDSKSGMPAKSELDSRERRAFLKK